VKADQAQMRSRTMTAKSARKSLGTVRGWLPPVGRDGMKSFVYNQVRASRQHLRTDSRPKKD